MGNFIVVLGAFSGGEYAHLQPCGAPSPAPAPAAPAAAAVVAALPSFLCFTRRFWNQIFTRFSDRFR